VYFTVEHLYPAELSAVSYVVLEQDQDLSEQLNLLVLTKLIIKFKDVYHQLLQGREQANLRCLLRSWGREGTKQI